MTSIGEELKTKREKRHLTIADIVAKTRISRRYIEYMEADRFDMLPGGIFNRSFLKMYARVLGADAEALASRYESIAPPHKAPKESSWPVLRQHKPFFRFLVSWGITLLLGVVGMFFIYREFKANRALRESSETTQAPLPDLSMIPPTAPSSTSVTPTSLPATATLESVEERVYPLNLLIEAVNQCWISVASDGRQITSQLLSRGDRLPFRANHQISLILGNAGGVNLSINDQQLRKPGGSGEVKRFVFTPENYIDYLIERASPQP